MFIGGGFQAIGCNRIADCRAGATTFKLDNPQFDPQTIAAFYTNGGTLVFSGQITTTGAFTMLQRQAAESVRSLGPNLPFDMSMLAKVNGDAAYNTNGALACGVGVADSNGTNWKNRYTAAIY